MTKQSDSRPAIGLFRLSLIAIFVGLVTGFGAIAFRGFIGFIHNLLFWDAFRFFMMRTAILLQVRGASLLFLYR